MSLPSRQQIDTMIRSIAKDYPSSSGKPVDEIEFSLMGPPNSDSSKWNLSIFRFRDLLTNLLEFSGLEKPQPESYLVIYVDNGTRVTISNPSDIHTFCKTDIIIPGTGAHVFENKTRLKMTDFGNFWRLRYNNERRLTDPKDQNEITEKIKNRSVEKTYRYAKRYSIVHPEPLGEKGRLSIDFTAVRQSKGSYFKESRLMGKMSPVPEEYEVELELTGLTEEELRDTDVINTVRKYLERLCLRFHGGMNVSSTKDVLLYTNNYIKLCKKVFPNLPDMTVDNLSQESMINAKPYDMSVFISSMDRTVLVSNRLIEEEYYFTDKADGIRAQLYVDENGLCNIIIKETVYRLRMGRDYLSNKTVTTQDKSPSGMLRLVPTGATVKESYVYFRKDPETSKKVKTSINYKNTVFDGELLEHSGKYYFKTFDIIIHNGKSVADTDFLSRYELFKPFNFSEGVFNASPKKFYKYSPAAFKKYVNSTLMVKYDGNDISDIKITDHGITYELDGIVFQPSKGPESHFPHPTGKHTTWHTVYKWKPLVHLTVDMKLDYRGKEYKKVTRRESVLNGMDYEEISSTYASFDAYSGKSNDLVISEYPCYAMINQGVPRASNGEPIVKGYIVECRLSARGGLHWVPVRIRHDKFKPNSKKVYDNAVRSITQFPITLNNLYAEKGGFGGFKGVTVTKLNRRVSNDYISSWGYQIRDGSIVLLDLGSGNAKSAMSWVNMKKATKKPVNVIGVDLDDVSKADMYMNAQFNIDRSSGRKIVDNAIFEMADFTKPLHHQLSDNIKTPGRFNIVTCVYAMHYAMETENTFRIFLANVTRNLTTGGMFIGSYMNKQKVLSVLGGKKETEMKMPGGDTLWKISLSGSPSPTDPFKGHSIMVDFTGLYKNNREYLIDLTEQRIKDISAEYGLELIDHISYNTFIRESKDKKIAELVGDISDGAQRSWVDLHYLFMFRKVKSFDSYIEMFKRTLTVEEEIVKTVEAETSNSPLSHVSGKKKIGAIKKRKKKIVVRKKDLQ